MHMYTYIYLYASDGIHMPTLSHFTTAYYYYTPHTNPMWLCCEWAIPKNRMTFKPKNPNKYLTTAACRGDPAHAQPFVLTQMQMHSPG